MNNSFGPGGLGTRKWLKDVLIYAYKDQGSSNASYWFGNCWLPTNVINTKNECCLNSTCQHENKHHMLPYFFMGKARNNLILYTKQQNKIKTKYSCGLILCSPDGCMFSVAFVWFLSPQHRL